MNFLLRAELARGEVEATVERSEISWDEGWVDSAWEEALAEARRKGTRLFNGRLFRLEGHEVHTGRLHLRLSPTDYRHYVATRSSEFRRAFPGGPCADPLSLAVAIESADGQLLVERRTGVDVHAGRLHVIGGFLDPESDGAVPDLFLAAAREVREEIGLEIDPAAVRGFGLVYDLLVPHPELCVGVRVSESFDDIRQIFEAAKTDGEVQRLQAVENSADELGTFLRERYGQVSPTGWACLLLWGAKHHGDGWRRRLLRDLGLDGG
jgi:8-oxo-dGTP pyrophosphatase MutT (NUDIX family)